MRVIKRFWWVLALVLLVGAGGWYLWLRGGTPQAAETAETVAVTRGSLTASISPTGEVQAVHRASLGFDVDRVALVELNVAAGQRVAEGDVLARVDEAPLQRAVEQAQANVLTLQEALEKAQTPYTDADQEQATLAVAQAETALQEAQEALADIQAPELEAARTAVSDASLRLQQAQNRLASLQANTATQDQIATLQWRYNEAEVYHGGLLQQTNVTEEGADKELAAYNKMMDAQDDLETAKTRAQLDLLTAQYNVAAAETSLAEARGNLATLQAGPTALALSQAQNRAAQARLTLAQAQDHLATASAGPAEKDVLLAQARYDAALATLTAAQQTLDDATLRAPFDGTVVSVPAQVGDLLTSSTTVLTLADLSDLRVIATIDETDIAQVAIGLQATITFDSLPGQRFSGQVLEVPLEGTLAQNVVTYPVPVSLTGAENAALLPGMTANVTIITGQRQDALLLPILAILQDDAGNYVLLQEADGSTSTARVEIGLDDGQYVEVLRGLVEGDRVLVQMASTTTSENAFRGRAEEGGFMMPIGGIGR